ncbi:hypothetical protein BO85DRAFT_485047 [Aspergillus piperis CBS 112811]|uniref:Uncharacterized protein n=1 Tax=Aspergillus piperis CBS 112811 TaxID=1448313 RepID=A0A8G1R871_9EURO|nr:hypothetical protein BO85DRAFT_485047 [Aspergillus piperis CBS 112811]RAH61314.1 hypothetical protein BO85DRAFT_485047 [Aspergillus piperis CBS 112811]
MTRGLEDISTDLTRTSASAKLYQETGLEEYRQQALEHATRLVRSLEKPAAENADFQLVERIMRVLVCNGFAKKRGLNHYAPTAWSTQMTERTTIDMAGSIKTGYKNPEDPYNTPLQYAYKSSGTCWDWFRENPVALQRFNTFMEGTRANTRH